MNTCLGCNASIHEDDTCRAPVEDVSGKVIQGAVCTPCFSTLVIGMNNDIHKDAKRAKV